MSRFNRISGKAVTGNRLTKFVEVFNTPVEYVKRGSSEYFFEVDGLKYRCVFERKNLFRDIWELSFQVMIKDGIYSHELIGVGVSSAIKVFSTITVITREWMNKKRPKKLLIKSDKTPGESRSKMYNTWIKSSLLPDGYVYDRQDAGQFDDFWITRTAA